MLRNTVLALTLVLATLGASAQNRMSGSCDAGCAQARPVPQPSGHTGFIGISGRPFRGRGFRGPFPGNSYLGAWPYFYPYYSDYADHTEVVETHAAQPAPAPAPALTPQVKQESLPEPVLLELQGNQWVRVTSFKTMASEPAAPNESAQAKPLPPSVLIFRDGHREEISSYSIIGPVIYTKGDYWATGNWTRSIKISDLDLPATLKENQQRGISFNLPAGPDEVVIRP